MYFGMVEPAQEFWTKSPCGGWFEYDKTGPVLKAGAPLLSFTRRRAATVGFRSFGGMYLCPLAARLLHINRLSASGCRNGRLIGSEAGDMQCRTGSLTIWLLHTF
jgi:hypothetical protein